MPYKLVISTNENTKDCILSALVEEDFKSTLEVASKESQELFCVPWDSYVTISDGEVIMQGFAGEMTQSTAEVRFPVGSFPHDYMSWEMQVAEGDTEISARLLELGFVVNMRDATFG